MVTTLVDTRMAKRKAKTATARIDEELIRMANVIAAIRDVSAPDYLSGLIRPLIERDYQEALKEESRRAKGKGDKP